MEAVQALAALPRRSRGRPGTSQAPAGALSDTVMEVPAAAPTPAAAEEVRGGLRPPDPSAKARGKGTLPGVAEEEAEQRRIRAARFGPGAARESVARPPGELEPPESAAATLQRRLRAARFTS